MKPANLSRNIPLFYVYQFLSSFVLDRGIWMLFLVYRGLSLTEVGLLETFYHFFVFFFEVPTGYVADRFGKRKSMLIAEALGVVAAILLVVGTGYPMLFVGFLVGAFAGTFKSGASSALVYETLKSLGKEARFKRMTSHLSSILLVALGFSGAAGGALADIHWEWVYMGKIVLHLLTLAVIMALIDPEYLGRGDDSVNTVSAKASFSKQIKESCRFMSRNHAFLSLAVYAGILYSMAWSIGFYSQVLFQQAGYNNRLIGVFNGLETWIGASVAAIAYVGERWLGKKGTLLLASIGFVLGFIGLAYHWNPVSLVVFFLTLSLLVSFIEPLVEAYLNELIPSEMRATLLSVSNMMISTGMMVVFPIIGFVADRVGLAEGLQWILLGWSPFFIGIVFWMLRR